MLKNPDRSGGKPESARRFCHALRSEAGGAFDISTGRGAKLAERSTYPREPERSWRSVRYPQEAERSWRGVRYVTESLIPGSRVFIVPGRSEGPERLSLPFPFSSKRRKEGGVGAIRSAGKERRRSSPLFPGGFSSETDPANP